MDQTPVRPQDSSRSAYEEDEISLLDLFVTLARQKKIIVRIIIVFTLLGLAKAMTAPPEYTSSATVIPEVASESSSSSALSALRGLGVNLGGGSTGLTADVYPNILKSREVRMAVVRDTFYFSDLGMHMTYVDYVNRDGGSLIASILSVIKGYTIGLPGKILGALSVGSDFSEFRSDMADDYPTKAEEGAIRGVNGLVNTSTDRQSGLFTISVTTNNPILSADLTQSFTDQLVARIRSVYTTKARLNLDFIQDRFAEAADSLNNAETALARFEDQNVSVTSARLATERQRLQRQVTFKSQLYSGLQAQLSQTEIELQRAAPVVTVIEQPVPSIQRSGPARKLTVLLSLILGGMVGIAAAFVRSALSNPSTDDESRAKLDEIKAALPKWPKRFTRKGFRPITSREDEA